MGSKILARYKPGLTSVSILAILYSSVVMTPVLIYMYLATGLPSAARFIPVFVTLLLFTEVGKYVNRFITTPEAYVMYFMAEIVAFDALYWVSPLQMLYYRKAPYTVLFNIANGIPYWAAPPLNSFAVKARTFLAPEWIQPILITVLGTTAGILIDIGLSFIFVQLYIEIENLPFPIAPIDAQAISTLTERTPEKMSLFTFAAIISFFYEFIIYGFPRLSEALIGKTITVIPYPWVDMTQYFAGILPGALMGVATDISSFAVGWVIPWTGIVWLLIGSLFFYVAGNYLGIALADVISIPEFRLWKADWSPVANISWLWQRSIYDLWASPQIGLILGVGIFTLAISLKHIVRAFKSLSRLSDLARAKGYLTLKWILLMIAIGSAIGIAVDIVLYPSLWFVWITIWIAVPFIQGVLLGRSYGEIGLGVQIPYVKEAFMLTFTKPGDVWPWLVPAKVSTSAGIITHRIKVAMLTKTRPLDYYKAYAMTIPIIIVISLVYLQIFWSIAPMPSSLYPWTAITWPIASLNFSLWVSRSIRIFKPVQILIWFLAIFVAALIARKFSLPFSAIGFAAGVSIVPPFAINYFIGALIGKFVEKKYGKEKWEKSRSVILAGIFAGIGLSLALSVAIAIVSKSVWPTPY